MELFIPLGKKLWLLSDPSSGVNYHQILLMLISQAEVYHVLSDTGAITSVWVFKTLRLDFLSNFFPWPL